ncbi:MAG: transaldolase, partial [Acaryochloridaceae cyanobacterium CSU_5_19]|nr:transaldolase [Acaryochloridaceae cyanobacterium CSU_5_19]
DGINVNVTLLFSVQSYIETAWAYIRGLEARLAKGQDLSKTASVASFFLSRIDSKVDGLVDRQLQALGKDQAQLTAQLQNIKGKVAIANAKIAYQEYKKIIQSDRWQVLSAKGAMIQRLLWASTSTKNPDYSDVMYVDELVGPDTVNTLPPETIEACADHCDVDSRIETNLAAAQSLIASLSSPEVKIDLDQVMAELLDEGIDKFVQPFESLLHSLEEKVERLAAA